MGAGKSKMPANPMKYLIFSLISTQTIFGCGKLNNRPNKPKNPPLNSDQPIQDDATSLCPKDDTGWDEWRRDEVKTLMSYRYTSNARHMGDVFEQCSPLLQTLPKKASCMANLRAFTRSRALEKKPSHTLGLEIADSEYFASVPRPEMMSLPPFLASQEFLHLLDDEEPDVWKKVSTLIDAENLGRPGDAKVTTLLYRSQSLPTPDDSQSFTRFLIVNPTASYIQFIQFGVRDSASQPLAQSISMVAISKGEGEHGASKTAYFNDLYRVRENGQVIVKSRLEANQSTLENCTRCHKSALIPIDPDPRSFDATKSNSILQAINNLIADHGAAALAHFDMQRDGPPLASGDPQLITDDFLRSCNGQNLSASGLARVKSATNCASCHNGHSRGALTLSSIDPRQLPLGANLVRRFVVKNKTMPPGADLSDAERTALVNCLEAQYSTAPFSQEGIFEKWLLQPGCEGQ